MPTQASTKNHDRMPTPHDPEARPVNYRKSRALARQGLRTLAADLGGGSTRQRKLARTWRETVE